MDLLGGPQSRSWIARHADGALEATWLAAAVVAPLLFNVYTERTFEADKVLAVRSLSLIVLAVGILCLVSRPRAFLGAIPGEWIRLRGLALACALSAVSMAASTALSVAPGLSWWGSFTRQNGTATSIAVALIALAATTRLRRPAQILRLEHAIVLGSLPVAIYALLQRQGSDPLTWDNEFGGRVAANLGNPVFLGSYLTLVTLLTLQRFARRLHELHQATTSGKSPRAAVSGTIVDGVVLVLQLAALLASGSRGAWLGLLTGAYLFFLLRAHVAPPGKRKRLLLVTVLCAAMAATGLAWINIVADRSALRDDETLGRLTELGNAGSGSGRVRVLLWRSAAEIATSTVPVMLADGALDSRSLLRPWIGYGPGTFPLPFARVYPTELARIESRTVTADHGHNLAWDALVTRGALGLLAALLLYHALFRRILERLELVRTRADGRLFAALWFGAGAVGAMASLATHRGLPFAGPALFGGCLAGLLAFVHVRVWNRATRARETGSVLRDAGVLAAVAAHLVGVQFGVDNVATRVIFWMLVAMAVAPARFAKTSKSHARAHDSISLEPVGALILIVLAFLFTLNPDGRSEILDIWGSSLSSGVFVMLLATLCAVAADRLGPGRGRDAAVRGFLLAAGAWAVFSLVQSTRLVPPTVPASLAAQIDQRASHLDTLGFAVALWLLIAGSLLSRGARRLRRSRIVPVVVVCILAAIAAGWTIRREHLEISRADVYFRHARDLQLQGAGAEASELFGRALALAPRQDHYWLFAGRALLIHAAGMDRGSLDPEVVDPSHVLSLRRDSLEHMGPGRVFSLSEAALRDGLRRNRANLDHTGSLALLYHAWARAEPAGTARAAWLDRALEQYLLLLAASPLRAVPWSELGDLQRERGDLAEAERAYRRGIALDPYLATPYRGLSALLADTKRFEELVSMLEEAVVHRPGDRTLESYLAAARVRVATGDTAEPDAGTAPGGPPG